MLDIKISALADTLDGASLDGSADLLPAVDVSAAATKKTTPAAIVQAGRTAGALPDVALLAVVAPAAPGATANINANAVQGEAFLSHIFSPAGEPADLSGGPYYLVITDGSNTETLVVTARSGVTRTLAGPLEHGYSAGSTTVAYAGPATTPAVQGLMPATALHQLLALAGDAVVFADGRVPVTGDLQLDAGAQLTAKSPAGNVELGPTGAGAIKFKVNGVQVAEVDSLGVNVTGKVNAQPQPVRTEAGAFTVDGTTAKDQGEAIRYTGTGSANATFNSGTAGHHGVISCTGVSGVLTCVAGAGVTLLVEEGLTAVSAAPSSGKVVSVGFTYLDATTVAITGNLVAA